MGSDDNGYSRAVRRIEDALRVGKSASPHFLDGLRLTALPPEIGQLTEQAKLSLFDHELSALPREISQMRELVAIDLSHNLFSEFPDALYDLPALRELHLVRNQLRILPKEIARLRRLEKFHLCNNELVNLPSEIRSLSNLAVLNLTQNKLTTLPRELLKLPNLKELYVHGNPALSIPPEVLGSTSDAVFHLSSASSARPVAIPARPQDILRYYFSATRPLLEARIIIIGDGGVGKTSLVRQLIDKEAADDSVEVTKDVVVRSWRLRVRESNVHLNVWDFGGQELMHAAHPYFFTERTLYLVVASSRDTGVEDRLAYWLRMVGAYGGKNATALAVVNKIDRFPMDVDRRGLCEAYRCLTENPSDAFHGTCCTDGTGIELLRRAIVTQLEQMDRIWEQTPPQWFSVKSRIAEMQNRREDVLTIEEWRDICDKEGVSSDEDRNALLDLLRNLGMVLSFPGTPLASLGVLNPEWVTKAIYPLLNWHDLTNSGGLLVVEDLQHLLEPTRYPQHRHDWIIRLMGKFELLFADENGKLLIPARLPKETPEWALDPVLNEPGVSRLELRFKDKVLPESVISRFIVRVHRDASPKGSWWRHGISIAAHDCQAIVRAVFADAKIEIRIRGTYGQRSLLLGYITGVLRSLGDNLGGELWVVLAEGLAEKYQDLLLLAGKETVIKRVVGGRVQEFDLVRLLDIVRSADGNRDADAFESGERIIQKVFIGSQIMGNQTSIDARGAVGIIFNVAEFMVGVINTVKQNVNQSKEAPGTNKLVEELAAQIAAAGPNIADAAKAKELGEDVKTLSAELAGSQRKKWYELSLSGLKDAATAVGEVGVPILATVLKLAPLLGVTV